MVFKSNTIRLKMNKYSCFYQAEKRHKKYFHIAFARISKMIILYCESINNLIC